MDIKQLLEQIALRASCAPHDDEEAASREFTRIMEMARTGIRDLEGTTGVDHKGMVERIHAILDEEGEEWDSETMSAVAEVFTDNGYVIRDPNEAEEGDDGE